MSDHPPFFFGTKFELVLLLNADLEKIIHIRRFGENQKKLNMSPSEISQTLNRFSSRDV
jgi:hypothetical protein